MEDDEDECDTVYSQTTMDAARAKANDLLQQADAATLRKSSAPPELSSLQAASKMGPHENSSL